MASQEESTTHLTLLAFTGTRSGMTDAQKKTVRELLIRLHPSAVRHGDCVGADADFHAIAAAQQIPIFIHPPINPTFRANLPSPVLPMPPKEYLARNRDMVDASKHLIAAPKEAIEQPTGGTWYTVRYAMKMRKFIYVVWPSGVIDESGRFDKMGSGR
jgi:hypothetical protein